MEADHTALSAWAIAIPSAITALSTWYTKRKIDKSDGKTGDAVDAATETLAKRVKALEDTVGPLTEKVEETRSCQVQISAKHTETMNAVYEVIRTLEARKDASNPAPVDLDTVTTIENPAPKGFGKTIIKP